MAIEEKRQFTRVPFVTQVKLSQSEQLWLGHVVDISFRGILVSSTNTPGFNPDQPVLADISFDNGSTMRVRAQQAHHHGTFYGFEFLEVDMDSMTHLRNIIMLNLADENACERELITLFSYHQ